MCVCVCTFLILLLSFYCLKCLITCVPVRVYGAVSYSDCNLDNLENVPFLIIVISLYWRLLEGGRGREREGGRGREGEGRREREREREREGGRGREREGRRREGERKYFNYIYNCQIFYSILCLIVVN